MIQDDAWNSKHQEVVPFIEKIHLLRINWSKKNRTGNDSQSFNNDGLVKQVTYLIGNEIAQGNHILITPGTYYPPVISELFRNFNTLSS